MCMYLHSCVQSDSNSHKHLLAICAGGSFGSFWVRFRLCVLQIVQLAAGGKIKQLNSAFYDLAEAPAAMEDMQARKIQGKAMIVAPASRAKYGDDTGSARL